MDIINLLKNKKKIIRITNIGVNKVVEFENETLLVIIENKKNVFKITKKDFQIIDDYLLPYAFLLVDTRTDEMFFMQVQEPNNFIRNAFDRTSKNEIFFGKEILQNRINKDKIVEKINRIGEV